MAVLNYETSGVTSNQTREIRIRQLSQVTLSSSVLNAGSYYATNANSNGLDTGLNILLGAGGSGSRFKSDVTSYYLLTNNQLDLAGSQNFDPFSAVSKVNSTKQYNPALPYGLMDKDSPVNQDFTITTSFTDTSKANTIQTKTQRIEFVGIESVNPGGTKTYTTCKFTNSEPVTGGTQVTTSWYLANQGILLQSEMEKVNTAGIAAAPTDTTKLVKAVVNSAVVFPGPN